MQDPRSLSDLRRLRPASMMLVANRLLTLTAGSLLLVSLFASDQHLIIFGPILVAASLLMMIGQWILASLERGRHPAGDMFTICPTRRGSTLSCFTRPIWLRRLTGLACSQQAGRHDVHPLDGAADAVEENDHAPEAPRQRADLDQGGLNHRRRLR